MRRLDREGLATLLGRGAVRWVLAALERPGAETRLVGGCVRDALLGMPAADIDLATTLLPEAVVAAASAAGIRSVPTGIAHGTVTLLGGEGPIEVTTLREDVETDGRHAVVRFGRDFRRDAERRDFAVNALSLGLDGRLHDTAGGLDDLAAGRVRFIGDPAIRIREDALRILRFFRFHARFGEGPPDAAALSACIAARDALDDLSRERVRAEFLKLLAAPGVVAMVASLSESGLLQRIAGGVAERGRLERAVAAGLAPAMRLAALSVGSRLDADRLGARLRLSRAEQGRLAAYADALAGLHGRAVIGWNAMRALAAGHGLPLLSETLAILAGEPRPTVAEDGAAALTAMLRDGQMPRFRLTGADLLAAGVPPGPAVGRALATARRIWLADGCPDGSREELLALAKAAAEGPRQADAPEDGALRA